MSGLEEIYIKEALIDNWVAPVGPHVDAFEKEVAQLVGAKGAVALISGTAAIHLALCLLHVNKGDRVFCQSLTFVASANPILYQGAEPVFIDSEPDSWNMSPEALERALHDAKREGKLPKAVIVVTLFGQSAKMDELLDICNYYGVPIIEDAAESLGTTYKEKASGTFGHFGIYSFNGNKIITTSGGGMLVSNDEDAIKRALFLATQAKEPFPYYHHVEVGYNYRLSNILAGIGRAQLQVLDARIMAKRKVFQQYYDALHSLPGIGFMEELPESRSNRWLTTITLDEEKAGITVEQLIGALQEENIEARYMWKPLHLQPLFQSYRYYRHEENTDVSAHLFKTGISLPSGSNLTLEEQNRVISCITRLFEKSFAKVELL